MEHSHDELWQEIRQLRQQVEDLQRKVRALAPEPTPVAVSPPPAVVELPPSQAATEGGAIPSVLGWALLGISGAYLLRALAERGVIPLLAGATVAVAWAAWWIYLAARSAAGNRLASAVYSVTALLLIAPLMWEVAVRFHALTSAVASAVLVCFTLFALGIAWRHRITPIAVVATWGGLLTATALFRETHDAAAWTASVLTIAAAVEFSACRDHWLGIRWSAAAFADITVLLLTMLALRNEAAVSGTLALAAQISLLGVYLVSTAERTLVRKLRITGFETAQAAAAFVIAIGGALYLDELTNVGSLPVGLFTLLCGLTCYAISYGVIARHAEQDRNFYVYSAFATAQTVIAWRVLLPASAAPAAWALFAPVLSVCGFATGRRSLRVHSAILLVLATAVSGAALTAAASLGNVVPPPAPALPDAVLLIGSLSCYAAILRFRRRSVPVSTVEALIPAAAAAWLGAGLLAWPLAHLPGSLPLRMALLAAAAALTARAGALTGFRELPWLTWLCVAAAAWKLFFTDLPSGTTVDVALSLTIAGLTLLLLPRLLRVRKQEEQSLRAHA